MGKYRIAPIWDPEDVGASGTKVIDIDINETLSALDIKWKVTKAETGMDAPDVADITRIELVDGSERLFSLSGYEAQALGYYNRPGRQMSHGQHLIANSQESHYPIDFGRWLWDKELAFDPKRHVNPQLRITFNEAISDTSVTANELEVTGFIFDEVQPSPRGFLSAIEEYSYTCGANNSFEIVDLPDDRIVRQILVRAYRDGYEPWAQIKEARLDESNLGKVPFDYTNLENYHRMMKTFWPQIFYNVEGRAAAGGAVFYVPQTDYWADFIISEYSAAHEVYTSPSSIKGGKATVVSASGFSFRAIVKGYLPWHCYQFPMGMPNVIEDWWDPKGKKPRLRLRAASSGANGTGQVIMEEVRPY